MAQILAYDNCFNLCSVSFKSQEVIDSIDYDSNSFKNLSSNILQLTKGNLIDEIRFTLGPGSFTGIRIGIATALGIRAVNDCRLLGCSTFDFMLMQALMNDINLKKEKKTFSLVIDPRRRGLVYFSKVTLKDFYEKKPNYKDSGLKNIDDVDFLVKDSIVITNHSMVYEKISCEKIFIEKCSSDVLFEIPDNRFYEKIEPIYFHEVS